MQSLFTSVYSFSCAGIPSFTKIQISHEFSHVEFLAYSLPSLSNLAFLCAKKGDSRLGMPQASV
jgi:hypothetical protein